MLSHNYAAKRLFLDKLSGAKYKDIRFLNWCLWNKAHLWFLRTIGKLNMTPEEQAAKLFYEYKAMIPTGCDLFHFFNTINYSTRTPWVVSVESGVPWLLQVTKCVESLDGDLTPIRDDKYVERAIKYLAANPIHNTKEQQDVFYHALKRGLMEKAEYVLTHRSEVKIKAENGLQKIRKEHDPSAYAAKLAQVYNGDIQNV